MASSVTNAETVTTTILQRPRSTLSPRDTDGLTLTPTDHIGPRPSGASVATAATEPSVPSRAPDEGVGTQPSDEEVLASQAPDGVVPAEAADDVRPGGPFEDILARGSHELGTSVALEPGAPHRDGGRGRRRGWSGEILAGHVD